jgi:hypothetical protein
VTEYKTKGRRVKLVYTPDQHTNLRPGDEGTAFGKDAAGTLQVTWDNGSTLGLINGVDIWAELEDPNGREEVGHG